MKALLHEAPRECRAQNLLTLSEKRRIEAALSPTSRASFRKISCWGRPGRGQCFSASVERSLSYFAWALRRLSLLQQPIFPTCRLPRLRTCRRAGLDSIWAARSATAWIAFGGEIWVHRHFFRRRIR